MITSSMNSNHTDVRIIVHSEDLCDYHRKFGPDLSTWARDLGSFTDTIRLIIGQK